MDRYSLWLGAGVISLAGLFYIWRTSKPQSLTMEGDVLSLHSLIKVLKSIRLLISQELVSIKREFVQERRKLSGERYQQSLHRFMQSQLTTIERVCTHTLSMYRVSPSLFDRSLARHASDPAVAALTDCFEPLSNSTFGAKSAPADMEIETFLVILQKHEAMLGHELRLKRVLSAAGMVGMQASISDTVYAQFGFDEMQVAAASVKFEASPEVKKLKTRIKQFQRRLMACKHETSMSV
jgi:hypothetical protein